MYNKYIKYKIKYYYKKKLDLHVLECINYDWLSFEQLF